MTPYAYLDAAASAFAAWIRLPPHDVRNGRDAAWEAFDAIVRGAFADPESAEADAFRDAAIEAAADVNRRR